MQSLCISICIAWWQPRYPKWGQPVFSTAFHPSALSLRTISVGIAAKMLGLYALVSMRAKVCNISPGEHCMPNATVVSKVYCEDISGIRASTAACVVFWCASMGRVAST